MPNRIRELEQALQQTWTRELLASYADALRAAGDPRGDIVAIDLQADTSDELEAQRDDAITRWIGTEWDYDDRIFTDKYGFIGLTVGGCNSSDEGSDPLEALLAAPFGGYVRHIRLFGTLRFLSRAVTTIASAARPWLARLELRRAVLQSQPCERTSITDVGPLVDATPHLKRLDVTQVTAGEESQGFVRPAAPVFERLVHPAVRSLGLTGYDELRAIADRPWRSVEHLDFAFGAESRFGDTGVDELAITLASAFPALRTLDLSRNEPTPSDYGWDVGSRHHAGELRVYEALAKLGVLSRLGELRLPSLRTDADVGVVQTALERMPALTGLEVARTYPSSPRPTLRHPTAKLVVHEPSAWPPCDQIAHRLDLAVDMADGNAACLLPLHRAIAIMEAGYHVLPKSVRQAWDQIWAIVGELVREADASRKLDANVLVRALDPLGDLIEHLNAFGASLMASEISVLRDRLGRISPSADVTLTLRMFERG